MGLYYYMKYHEFKDDLVYAYLSHVAATGNKSEACEVLGLSPSAVGTRRREDLEFAEEERAADARFNDCIRSAMVRRAIDGVDRDVWYQGAVVGKEVVYSDMLLKELSKRLPDMQQKHEVEVTTSGLIGLPTVSSWGDE